MSEAKSISELVGRLRHPQCVDANCVKCKAASALESQAAEIARLRPPHTPEGLHWLGDIGKETHGCVAYFKDEVACLAFMQWLGERHDEARAALGDTPAGLD